MGGVKEQRCFTAPAESSLHEKSFHPSILSNGQIIIMCFYNTHIHTHAHTHGQTSHVPNLPCISAHHRKKKSARRGGSWFYNETFGRPAGRRSIVMIIHNYSSSIVHCPPPLPNHIKKYSKPKQNLGTESFVTFPPQLGHEATRPGGDFVLQLD